MVVSVDEKYLLANKRIFIDSYTKTQKEQNAERKGATQTQTYTHKHIHKHTGTHEKLCDTDKFSFRRFTAMATMTTLDTRYIDLSFISVFAFEIFRFLFLACITASFPFSTPPPSHLVYSFRILFFCLNVAVAHSGSMKCVICSLSNCIRTPNSTCTLHMQYRIRVHESMNVRAYT